MDTTGTSSEDCNPPPNKKARYSITKNGRAYSQSHSYKLLQKKREEVAKKSELQAQQCEELFTLRKELIRNMEERKERLNTINNDDLSPLLISSHNTENFGSSEILSDLDDICSTHSESEHDVSMNMNITPPMIQTNVNIQQNNNTIDVTEKGNQEEVTESFKEKCRRYFTDLHSTFTRYGVVLAAQDDIIAFFKDLPVDVLQKIPKQGRSLRPKPLPFTRKVMPPGEMTYFGIKNMLEYAGEIFYNTDSNEINLYCNMDGLPLSKSGKSNHFWPIWGSVDFYPVFLIAAYEGPGEPVCANEYLRSFVDEVKLLTTQGCTLRGRTYKFSLRCLICDSPASSLITGTKRHGGYSACRRCKTIGVMVPVIGVNVRGKLKGSMRYPDIDDTEIRTHEEYVEYALLNKDPHDHPSIPTSSGNENNKSKNGKRRKKRKGESKTARKLKHHLHPTILTEIPNFDIVRCVLLDPMHIVGGLVKTMLERFNGTSISERTTHKLSNEILEVISKRIINCRPYCPAEFAREPDPLTFLKSWKMVQSRQFVLYLGAVVLRQAISDAQLHHFHLLVVALRFMSRRLPDLPHERRAAAERIAEHCRFLLKHFFYLGNELYTELFSVYNAHIITHMPDDYERFAVPLDFLSAYRFENANGHLKALVTGHFQPLTQVQNKISSLVHTKVYGRTERNKKMYSVEEYYEIPKLSRSMGIEDDNIDSDTDNEPGSVCCERFEELRFKNFLLRTSNKADCYVHIRENLIDNFMKLEKILQNRDTEDIFLVGRIFDHTEALFSLHDDAEFDSMHAGIHVCSNLSKSMYTFSISALSEKCFALPLNLDNPESSTQWVLQQFLH